jgi:hypothetical protein
MKTLYKLSMLIAVSGMLFYSCETEQPETPTSLPTVAFDSITQTSSVSLSSAKFFGRITNSGKLVTKSGLVYSKTLDDFTMTNADTILYGAAGILKFNIGVTKLKPLTKIKCRMFASNLNGATYSDIREYIMPPTLPRMTNDSSNSLTSGSANLFGTVTSTGGEAIKRKGFLLSTATTPAMDIFKSSTYVKLVESSDTTSGFFSIPVSGLNSNQKYFYRSFVQNRGGYSYGGVKNFTTTP